MFLRGGQGGLVVVASLERLARRPEELEELRGRLLGARASLATVELFGRYVCHQGVWCAWVGVCVYG